jgi:RecA/RadA recombinase
MSDYMIGIKCPTFALEWLTGNNAIPLETVIQLYGPRGIGKSGLAFELMRLFRKDRGIGHYFEHESKFNAVWAKSIIGVFDECMAVIPCYSINEWEQELQLAVRDVKAMMTGNSKELGYGRTFPWLGVVDSIMGKPFQETIDKVKEQGFAGRNHPIEAMSITTFVKAFAGELAEWPFMLVCVNHLKEKKSETGIPEKTRSGGQTIDFQGAYEFEVQRIGRIRQADIDGNKLMIKCMKNSFGIDDRRINVNVIWYDDEWEHPETGNKIMHQRTIWDWHGATAILLCNDRAKGQSWTDARKACGGLTKVNEGKYYAPKLGIPRTQAIGPSKMGSKISKNPKILEQLRDIFSINRMKIFTPAVDYVDQLKKMKEDFIETQERRDDE